MRQVGFLWIAVLFVGCQGPVPSPFDGGSGGGGGGFVGHDAGPTEAGARDAGAPDAGSIDAGRSDGGALDAGAGDAGVDGGPRLVVGGRSFGGPGRSFIASAVAVGSDLYVVGNFSGEVDFGSGAVLASPGSTWNGFIARYDSVLALQWVRPIAGPSASVLGVSYDPVLADLVVAGQFETSIAFGSGGLQAVGRVDSFVARVSTAGSVTSWVHLRPTDGGAVWAERVASTPGKLAVVGRFVGPFSTDGGSEASPAVDQASGGSAFVAFYDSNLAPIGTTWAASALLSYTLCSAVDVAADAVGDFYVLGESLSLCRVAGTLVGRDPGGNGGTRFVWKLRAETSTAWVESYGQKMGYGDYETLLVDGASLFIAGATTRAVDPTLMTSDGGLISRPDGGPLFDDGGSPVRGVLVRVAAATGVASWAERHDIEEGHTSRGVAVSPSGSVYFLGAVNTGGLLLTRLPGAPDPTLLASTRAVPYTSQLVRLGTTLAAIGFQDGPFSVGSLAMDSGITDGGRSAFILLVAP